MSVVRRSLALLLTAVLALGIMAPGVSAGGQTYADTIQDILDILRTHYLHPIDQETEARMLEESLKGPLRGLDDPYTTYMSPDEYREFVESLEAEQRFGGVGVQIEQIGDYITVVSPLRGTPGEEAGLEPRDRILKVDGINLVGEPLEKAVYHIRGEPGTPVTLTVWREGAAEHLEITIVREEIVVTAVEYQLKGEVGYISLANFPMDAASRVRDAVENLRALGAESFILDLRGNSGGYLNAAIATADLFLPAGEAIVDIFDREGLASSYVSRREPATDAPLVVLVDAGSASATEIVAAALREPGRATLVGTETFGKGTVQNLMFLSTGGVLKVTTSEFRTPAGRNIESWGVRPHLEVEGRQAQLTRALMYLRGQETLRVRFPTDRSYVVRDGRRLEYDYEILVSHQDRPYFHLETVADLFDLEVDTSRDRAVITWGDVKVELAPGGETLTVNGREKIRPRSSALLDGRVYVHLDLLQEFLGFVGEHERLGRWVDLHR